MIGHYVLVFSFGLVALLVSSLPQNEDNLIDLQDLISDSGCDNNTPIKRTVHIRDSQDYSVDTPPQTQDDVPTTDVLDDSINQGFLQGLKSNPYSSILLI